FRDPRAAHRARDVRAFLAVGAAITAIGASSPAVYAADIPRGLLLLEDFGHEGVLATDGAPLPDRYRAAIEVLAHLHRARRPGELPIGDGSQHRLPGYGAEAFAVEVELFADWYVPVVTGGPLAPAARSEFVALWRGLTASLAGAEENWVLLDFH